VRPITSNFLDRSHATDLEILVQRLNEFFAQLVPRALRTTRRIAGLTRLEQMRGALFLVCRIR
jgi:hypothetical protein